MLAGLLALIVAAAFAGASLYVNIAEQPARLALDDRALLLQWQGAHKRGFAMQAPLCVVGCLLGLLAWWQIGGWGFVVGAVAMIASGPWTGVAMAGINKALWATEAEAAGPATRALIARWAARHAVRTALGFAATVAFLAACRSA